VPFLRFTRDKRGYEHTYLLHASAKKGGLARLLYWYRTPPGVRVGRPAFDESVRQAIEAQYPGISFDWPKLMSTPVPPPDVEHWRERRRAERAARQARQPVDRAQREPDEEVDESEQDVGESQAEGLVARASGPIPATAEEADQAPAPGVAAEEPEDVAASQGTPIGGVVSVAQGQSPSQPTAGAAGLRIRRRRRRGGRRRRREPPTGAAGPALPSPSDEAGKPGESVAASSEREAHSPTGIDPADDAEDDHGLPDGSDSPD